MRYDPNDRDQRDLLFVPHGMSMKDAIWQHMMRTGYAGGFFVYFQNPGETPQETLDRVEALNARPCYPEDEYATAA